MKRIVDIFTKDWTSELVWSYIITSENAPTSKTIDAIERDALQLAIEAEPFWIAWRPLESGQVGYCQTDAVPPVQYMGIQALMSAEINVRGLAYD